MGGRVYSAAVVRQRSFFLRNRLCVKEGLHWRFAEAPAPLMRPVPVKLFEPLIEIGLQPGN
jgi:hypothetical protein